jgi:sporulation protein YlmC with PRC-barrel domain
MDAQKETRTHFIPTTELKLYDVVNYSGEDLGQVQNFIIDMCSSRIAYVLIAFEGFIGLTDKWIPVPFDALTWMPEKNTFEMNIPRKTMEQAPVISKSEWPDKFLSRLEMRDHSAWLEKIYDYYNCEPYWIEHSGDTCCAQPSAKAGSTGMQTHFVPTSRLKSYDIVSDRDEVMGQVERIIVDICSGQAGYMLVSVKRHPGDLWVAVPPEIMTWQPEKNRFKLDVPRETLEKALPILKSEWPDKFLVKLEKKDHAEWLEDIYDYYNIAPFWIVVE